MYVPETGERERERQSPLLESERLVNSDVYVIRRHPHNQPGTQVTVTAGTRSR